jgi:hypothetical protein
MSLLEINFFFNLSRKPVVKFPSRSIVHFENKFYRSNYFLMRLFFTKISWQKISSSFEFDCSVFSQFTLLIENKKNMLKVSLTCKQVSA